MESSGRFRLNTPRIIHETIDRETIMVNLEEGSYYSLNPVATYIWEEIANGAAIDEIPDAVTDQFAVESTTADPEVRAFLDQLIEQKLIVPLEGEVSSTQARQEFDGVAYEPPTLNRYTDMQELLLLDPVHEVDPAGWPQRG